MKKNLLASALLSTALLLSACSADTSTTTAATTTTPDTASDSTDAPISIVTSTFYEYDWVCEILGDQQENFAITLLMDNGVDMHSYEPTVADIATISSADLFIHNGGESDTWVADIIAQPMNENLKVLNMTNVIGDLVKSEVTVEGMQETEHSHDHEDEEVTEDDEHIWLSLENAIVMCNALTTELVALDPDHAQTYLDNAENYTASLSELSASYATMVSQSARDTVIFADRFPFLYLMSDYDISYYAAFQGCSAETEASFETILFLTEMVNELEVNYVLIIDNGLEELANTIISNSQNADCQILVVDSMQSTTQQDISDGATYYSIMEENLQVLALALGE